MPSAPSGLKIRDEGPVRLLILLRPPGNTLDLQTLKALRAAAVEAGRDHSVRALVVGSDLPRYFSSGLDLEEMESLPEARRFEPFEALLEAYRALLALPKPTVAALSGSSLMGGWVVAMSCDWRLLAAGAKISLAEIRAALTPTAPMVERLKELACDPRVVKDMVLRGKVLGAEEAEAAALVDGVLPEDEIMEASLSLARRLAKSPPGAYASVKRALFSVNGNDARWAQALEEFSRILAGEEGRVGVLALRQKRRPRWEG